MRYKVLYLELFVENNMKMIIFTLLISSIILLHSCGKSKSRQLFSPKKPIPLLELDEKLPVDSKVIKKKLPNGITYFIRRNQNPEKRAELRLVVNAGSILERDDQQGLAHFCEHMAFNGTKNFQKQALVNYLETIGMRFGPDINAYTNFDETVYMLQIPTDSLEIIQTAFQILEDWAYGISFDDEEIEKERGVIIEEWRLGRGAEARMFDKQYPILFQGSKYAERLPIGEKAVLDTFHYESLRQFYREWYQPQLMAVIAIGDFDVEHIEDLIFFHFNKIPSQKNAPKRELFPVPDHDETLFAIASDPEARMSRVGIYFKLPVKTDITVSDYREGLVELLYNRMFNKRLSELTQEADPPFIFAASGNGKLVQTSDVYMLNAVVRDNGVSRGLKTLLVEARRVREHGFTSTELEREKLSALRDIEQAFIERDKVKSDLLAAEYTRNFLHSEPIPGIETEYNIFKKYIYGISLDEVHTLVDEWIKKKNRVIMISTPEKEGIQIPNENLLQQLLNEIGKIPVEPYQEKVIAEKLIDKLPKPGQVIGEKYIDELNLTEWQLDNGVTVILKPTDFKNDEILFTAFSPGGTSLIPDSVLIPGQTVSTIISESGVGKFDKISLMKYLSDKVVSVSPYLRELSEGFFGKASPKDIETLFQLIYLYFTSPRMDSTAFASIKARLEGIYQNREVSPEAAYQDTIRVTLTQYHPRYLPWTIETLAEMDLEESAEIYRDRFASANDFTFIFIGNFTVLDIKPLIEIYLGGLPIIDRQESWKDVSYDYPSGVVEKVLKRGIEPKSNSTIIFTGPFTYDLYNRLRANAMAEMLQIKLRERIREDLSGTYHVSVDGNYSRYPRERYRITISFGSNPDRAESLKQEIFFQIDTLKVHGFREEYLTKVKQKIFRKHETNVKENSYWLSVLETRYFHNEDPKTILDFNNILEDITLDDIKIGAKKYLNMDNYIRVVLFPENQGSEKN